MTAYRRPGRSLPESRSSRTGVARQQVHEAQTGLQLRVTAPLLESPAQPRQRRSVVAGPAAQCHVGRTLVAEYQWLVEDK